MRKYSWILALVGMIWMSFISSPQKLTIYLIGDSTLAAKSASAFPETGWGMPFANFFSKKVLVDNRAKNGRSTKTFISENLWAPVVSGLHKGDYVLIQFGHNDEVKTKASYTPEEDYVKNLMKFIQESREKGAIPILITPVARRSFDTSGKVKETHLIYANLVRELAKSASVPLIDLDKKSQELLQQYGAEQSKLLFNHLEPGEHPNYPEGKKDDTHFNELGAREMAQLVLKEMRTLNLPDLSRHGNLMLEKGKNFK
ncbi:rhamnogalacturonan acetylesterase [Pedobacter gandavensis]|uniref:GntR family transcriptional regulator n=1 Tax=Pedobacter gandavensis TaxID=2679963 RepID=A0ABR6ER08_9SPHI|nr:rhamnogalacturonan acetylesterase [Pedobacter gandavensis]MBB2147699.1 GntR family transcriptional regulator [Pedobacter gandavensis]